MKKIFLLLIMGVSLSFQSLAQDRKVDVLEVLYNQKNYRSLVRKTNKMIDKKGYSDNELVHLFRAVALARLSQDEKYTRSKPTTLKKSTEAFVNYYELDKQLNFQQESSILIVDLREIYNAAESVSIKSEAYDYLMKGVTSAPVIRKKQVVIVKNQPGKSVNYPDNYKASAVDTVCNEPYANEVDKMISYAKKFIGVPYVYGGTGDGGFDCSGYTQFILGRYGSDLPRSARTQKTHIEPIKIKQAQKGDLVFFSNSRSKNNITHVGIVISERGEELEMIHASSSQGIMISNIPTNSYWQPRLVGAGRPQKDKK